MAIVVMFKFQPASLALCTSTTETSRDFIYRKKDSRFRYQYDRATWALRQSPLLYFSQYFPNQFFQDAAECTNQYSILKTGKSLKTNGLELKLFFAANLIMDCVTFPQLRMYWDAENKYPPVADIISRNRFLELRNAFHVVGITKPPADLNENKLWKVQPILDAFRKVCLSFPRDHVTYSVDEQMIPFTGRCPVRQFVKNKPRPVGLKNFVLCTSTGLVLDFEIYQGQSTRLVHPELRLGPSVILTLVETLPPKSFVYFDRYFTTLPLLEKLNELNICRTGTISANRISGFEKGNEEEMERALNMSQNTISL